ncbi:unnamed protein product [Nezara viridula]|uniref:MARVEL domain-containing protein n=1 Tax=Nezara viridula TaxID=85310 RepID=A0A9P0HN48_NEZVI|nr:unnamed protein product [Nezara viridula]
MPRVSRDKNNVSTVHKQGQKTNVMSHTVTVTRTTTTTSTSAIIINTGYMKTFPGLLKLLEVVVGGVALTLICVYINDYYTRYGALSEQFFLAAVTTVFVASFCLLLSCLLSLSTATIIAKTMFILGGLCQTMLMNFGPAQAQLIGMSFYSLLSANAAATSGVTLLLTCYVISENTYHLIKTSIFEIVFNLSAAFSYLSASTCLAVAVNVYLYPVYLVTMGFISYPAMIAAYTIGFALGITHAVDAYHAYRHYKGFPTN